MRWVKMLVFAAAAMACLRAFAGDSVTLDSLLREMVDRDSLPRLPAPAYTCGQASSYDRQSVAPDKPGWFANHDTAQFIRVEKRAGHDERVMMDAAGPGAIVRFWMGAPQPRAGVTDVLRIYLDGHQTPAVELTGDELLAGKGPIKPPLSAVRCIGRNLYLPIPYALRCKVTSEGHGNCWYNIEYRTYPAPTPVRTFAMAQLGSSAALIEQVQQTLLRPGVTLPANLDHHSPVCRQLAPGGSMETRLQGPAAVRMFSARVSAVDLPRALRATVIAVECDGEKTVWCPLGDFFGSGIGLNPYRDWYREVDRDGPMTCYWVMPFRQSCAIRLENLGDRPVDAVLGSIATSPWQWDDRSMHFHATWRQEYPIKTRRADGTCDWNYVEIQGQGVYVGDALALFNGDSRWWGEGDEKIYVDGESFPSHFGTGTEDYYGYSFGAQGVFFQAPFHAEPRWDGNNKQGYVSVTRSRSLDAIPFGRSLKFDMEIWHWSATLVGYAATTYWYARPGAKSNRSPQPLEAAGPLPGVAKPAQLDRALDGGKAEP